MWVPEAETWMAEHRGNVAEVVQLARRDETGMTYEVRLRLENVPHAAEQADWEIGPLWEMRVEFSGPACLLGFIDAARTMGQAAAQAWEKTR